MIRSNRTSIGLLALVALFGCSKKDDSPAPLPVANGTLSVDIRQSVTVTLTKRSETEHDIDLAFGEGEFSYFDASTTLRGKGTIERFPEADTTMYVATWNLPARASSPCKSSPIALALSLARRGANARVGGALTAYCGDKAVGVPSRLFRITGNLPLP